MGMMQPIAVRTQAFPGVERGGIHDHAIRTPQEFIFSEIGIVFPAPQLFMGANSA